MRLLVLSNVPGSTDKIADILQNHSNIHSRDMPNVSNATIAQTAGEQLRGRSRDQVIVVARDPIGAGMLLNKQDGVDAAVCGSLDDVKLAKENGANVIVIRDINSNELQEIVAQAAGSGGVTHMIKMPQMKMPQIKMPETRAPQPMPKQQEREEKRQKIVMPKKAKQEAQQEEQTRTHRSNGVVDKIKDYLGIL